jgi:hypothetical protein
VESTSIDAVAASNCRGVAFASEGMRSRRKDHMKDERLSAAILSYVGWDTDAALPGRYLDRIADGH